MNKLQILVADDHEIVRKGLVSLIKTQPAWEVCGEAENGRQAVELAKQLRPAIVVLDIGMPKLNGHDAARLIRQQPWGKNMLLIALTGWGREEDRRQTEAAGFNHHLVKPVDARTLLEVLAELHVDCA